MARRRKKLKRRLLSYDQIATILRRRAGQGSTARLYGNVQATVWNAHFTIMYQGKSKFAVLADVWRLADGASAYVVCGYGKLRNSKKERWYLDRWLRYVPVFTPLPVGERLLSGQRKCYRVLNGEVTEWPMDSDQRPLGRWLTMPQYTRRTSKYWVSDYEQYPKFCGRARRFLQNLRARLKSCPPSEVQFAYRGPGGLDNRLRYRQGVGLRVCTPPVGRTNGKALDVVVGMHDAHSRSVLDVDFDYGTRHCVFSAIDHDAENISAMLMWKCARDAIEGIAEWVNSTLYIPGPMN